MDEPIRDPMLADALRAAEGEVPFDAVEWTALSARIRTGAALPLARRRRDARAARTRRLAVRWAVPLAAAATVAGLALGRAPATPAADVRDEIARQDPTIETIVNASLPDPVERQLSGEADRNAVLAGMTGS